MDLKLSADPFEGPELKPATEQNHYDVLGVDQDATQPQLKAAYRALAKELHPDLLSEEEADAFKVVSIAYATLSDPQKRAEFDAELGDPGVLRAAHPLKPEDLKTTWVGTQLQFTAERIIDEPGFEWDEFASVLRFAQTKDANTSVVFHSTFGLDAYARILDASFGSQPNDFTKVALALTIAELGVAAGEIDKSQEIPLGHRPAPVQAPWLLTQNAIRRVQLGSLLPDDKFVLAVENVVAPLMNTYRGDHGLLDVARQWSYFPAAGQPQGLLFMAPENRALIHSRGLGTEGLASEVTKNLMARLIWMDGLDNPYGVLSGAAELVVQRTLHDSKLLEAQSREASKKADSGLDGP